ncbi:MAG: heavy metal-binding domain-containing protein, partial [Candidatus Saccharimonadales bacterium]
YQPISFVFGNVAYSIGFAGHIMANIRQLARGEVRAYSDLFNTTRNLALQRIVEDAKLVNANAVIGIETTILPFGTSGVQEMVMIGTASQHPLVSSVMPNGIVTSDLTAEETWNIAKLGYMPMQLVLGTSVYSLGVVGGLKSALKEMVHGEVSALTQMIYGARENSIAKLQNQASAVNADDVLGIKTYVYQLGGDLIELLAIGTAVKRMEGLTTRSPQLPPQAIIRDKDTFINTAELHFGVDLNTESVNS